MKKMKIPFKTLIGLVAVSAVWAATPAAAIPITDSVDPTDTLITNGSTPSPCPSGFTCTTSALSFVQDIADNGFNAGLDIITSATISIHLMDTGGSEGYQFDIGTVPQTFTSVNVPGGSGSTDIITLNAASLADLAADGMISVKVSSTSGSFSFADSLLTAQVTKFDSLANGVPEPSTLLLFGAGLLGLGSRLRRRS